MAKFKAAVVQIGSSGEGTAATVEKTIREIQKCGKNGMGANVAAFPEALIGGYPKGSDFNIYIGGRTPEGREEFRHYYDQAINVPGVETDAIGEACKDAELYVTIGVIERDGGTLYCTALYFGPNGALLGKRRKLMPTALERLCWGFGDGSTLTAVDTPWGKMGATICWENYMPLLRTSMYDKGVSIYCAPTADDRDSWAASMRHIAMEGRCFVLSPCQFLTGKDFPDFMKNRISDDPDNILMRGGSVIVDPLGNIVAGPVFDEEATIIAELDTDDISRGKFDFDVVGHYARPDIFKLEVDERPKSPVEFKTE